MEHQSEPQAPRASIMQLTQGWVLLVDGKTLAYQTIPALTRGIAKEIKKRPRVALGAIQVPASTPQTTAQTDGPLQIQLFNFGRVQAEAAQGEMDLATYERAGVQYFPDVYTLPWAAQLIQQTVIQLSERPTTIHKDSPKIASSPQNENEPLSESPRDKARRLAREKAERDSAPATANAEGSPWVHEDCGRESDCFINTAHGIEIVNGTLSTSGEGLLPCPRCQQCLDDTCELVHTEDRVMASLEETQGPQDIEPDEDDNWTTPAIVLNEKGERIGMTEV